jgi:hypothetical protein
MDQPHYTRPQLYALELAEILLQKGANVNLTDQRGFTVAMVAREYQPMMGDGFIALLSAAKQGKYRKL